MAAATLLARQNPSMTFVYVSGAGTDSTGMSRQMWARVKGRTENAVLALPFKGYVFRPAFIEPMHGSVSSTRLYRVMYTVLKPLFPLLRVFFSKYMTSTENVGRAMLEVAKIRASQPVIENVDIETLARNSRARGVRSIDSRRAEPT
jgi:hypothetical protein